jgi:hypothetical protein
VAWEELVTVIAAGDGEFSAWVGDAARPLVIEALDVQVAATKRALAEVADDRERRSLEERLELVTSLRGQLGATAGRAYLTGPEQLVVRIVRDAASQAAHRLDATLDAMASASAVLTEEAIADLRASTISVTSGVEALIACESHRRAGGA